MIGRPLGLLLVSLLSGGGPIDLDIEEQVEVRLVLVDFLALDRAGRTVSDVERDELELLVNGRAQQIASLDRDCPAGTTDEPRAATSRAEEIHGGPAVPSGDPRKIVLVFDYFHMTNVVDAYDAAQRALDRWPLGDEEHLVVSLGQTLRLETPFTADRDEVRAALRRMRNDPALFAGNYGRLTERRFFARLRSLFDILGRMSGRKTVVLFSGPFLPDGFTHDSEYRELSALSTEARTAIYPVDSGGLRTPIDPASRFGGPPALRRLANETGGRMTSETNDLSLAYGKAHRDMGCAYTLGFYTSRIDSKRRLTLRVARKGVRLVYPEYYVVRSLERKRRSLFATATQAPSMFETGEVSAELFVLGPRSRSRWRALLAVEVRLQSDRIVEADEEWEIRGIVRKANGTQVHSFGRQISMTDSPVTFFREMRLRPGHYVVSAVLSDPRAEAPLAVERRAVVAPVPRGEPFIIGPILGGRGTTFEPLVVREVEPGDPLESLTLVCVVDTDVAVQLRSVDRVVTGAEGTAALRFAPVSAEIPAKSDVPCHEQLDRIDTAGLQPGRYEITVEVRTSERVTGRSAVSFSIRPPAR